MLDEALEAMEEPANGRWRRGGRTPVGADPIDSTSEAAAARKLLPDGVGAGIVEREATKSRWPRLGNSLRSSRVKRGTEMLLLLVD